MSKYLFNSRMEVFNSIFIGRAIICKLGSHAPTFQKKPHRGTFFITSNNHSKTGRRALSHSAPKIVSAESLPLRGSIHLSALLHCAVRGFIDDVPMKFANPKINTYNSISQGRGRGQSKPYSDQYVTIRTVRTYCAT